MKYFIIRTILICLVATPIYLVVRQPWKRSDRKKEILLALFAVYMTCLIMLTLKGDYASPIQMYHNFIDRLNTHHAINFVPFKTILGMIDWGSTDEIWVNIISNLLIFIPFGFLLPALWENFRKLRVLLPVCLCLPVAIEFLQLFINRHTDIDDIILNFIGGLTGAVLYQIIKKLINKKQN